MDDHREPASEPAAAPPEPSGPIVYWETPEEGSQPRVRIGHVMGRTLDTYGSQAWLFLALALPTAILSGLLGAFSPTPGAIDGIGLPGWVGIAGLVVVGVIVGVVASALTILAVDEMWQGREPGIASLLGRALGRTPALLGAYLALGLVLALVVLLGLLVSELIPTGVLALLAVVLGVMVLSASIRLTLLPQVIVLERVGVLPSFRRAWELSKGSTWRLLGLLLVALVVTIPATVGSELMASLSSEPIVAGLAALIAAMITTPLLAIATTIAWADMTERAYVDNDVVRRGKGRAIALALVLGLGILLTAAGLSGGGANGFDNLLPLPGQLRTGTERNPFDGCLLNDTRTSFTSGEAVLVGGYLEEVIPRGGVGLVQQYVDGQLTTTAPIDAEQADILCYQETFPDPAPGEHRVVVRYGSRTVAEGVFTVVP